MKRIVFKTEDGGVGILIPSQDWTGTLEELANKDVPEGCEWRIVESSALPVSRAWRNAWTDELDTGTVDVDLERAKEAHKDLIIAKSHERIEGDKFGDKDFSTVKAELEKIDFDLIKTKEELFNTWTPSTDNRGEKRGYKEHE